MLVLILIILLILCVMVGMMYPMVWPKDDKDQADIVDDEIDDDEEVSTDDSGDVEGFCNCRGMNSKVALAPRYPYRKGAPTYYSGSKKHPYASNYGWPTEMPYDSYFKQLYMRNKANGSSRKKAAYVGVSDYISSDSRTGGTQMKYNPHNQATRISRDMWGVGVL